MRARTLTGWILEATLVVGVVAWAIAQDGLNPAQTAVSTDVAGAAASVEPATPAQAAPQPSTTPPAATPAATADLKPASNGYASPWYYEIETLTKAGVEDGVVLSYVFNSAGLFNVTAEQVIALKNLGTSPQVISAMMQHDRQLLSGERPLTASTPPPFSPSVEAALAASVHRVGQVSAPPAPEATPTPASPAPMTAPEDESGAPDTAAWVEPNYPPDPPQGLYPVRLPYPVKLNDPIIILRLPTFTLPCW